MERKVGEIFTYADKTYKVVQGTKCRNCDVKGSCIIKGSVLGPCTSDTRSDKTHVVFKEIKGMELKNTQLTIEIPNGMEIDFKNSNLDKGIIKFREKGITYDDIENTIPTTLTNFKVSIDTRSKLCAINHLMNIAKYYNGDWKPDWKHRDIKYYIYFDNNSNKYDINYNDAFCRSIVYFKKLKRC